MDSAQIEKLEALVFECDGDYALTHCRRMWKLIEMISQGMDYDRDVLLFCAYAHDFGHSPPYAKEGVGHAQRSGEVAETIAADYGFDAEQQALIREAIALHHKETPGESSEAILLRDAEFLDSLGCIGIARDITKNHKNLKRALQSILWRKDRLPGMLVLESSKRIAKQRVLEMDGFLSDFILESFGYC